MTTGPFPGPAPHPARRLRPGDRVAIVAPSGPVRRSRLPSGWTPLELLRHLACVERGCPPRLRPGGAPMWGFDAEPVEDAWADQDSGGRWHVPGA